MEIIVKSGYSIQCQHLEQSFALVEQLEQQEVLQQFEFHEPIKHAINIVDHESEHALVLE